MILVFSFFQPGHTCQHVCLCKMNTKQKHIGKCQNMVYMRRLRKSYEDQIETRWPCSATLSDMIATVDAHPLLFLGQEANVQN